MKLAVLGAGVMGRNHVRVASQLSGVDVVGVYDADQSRATIVAREFGVTVMKGLPDVLSSNDIDSVVVATPTVTHEEIGLEAIRAGKHVLVEKPLAPDPDACMRLVEAAREEKVTLAVGHIERHNPVVRFAHNALGNGSFGTPFHLAARRVSSLPERVRDVGVILDLGIHDIDVIRYLAGGVVDRVYCQGLQRSAKNTGEDQATIFLAFDNGLTATVEVNWHTPMKVRRLDITAEAGFVELDYMRQQATIHTSSFSSGAADDPYLQPVEFQSRIIQLANEEPLRNELRDFADAVEGRIARPLVDGDDGMTAVSIAHAALESMKTGDAVRVRTPQAGRSAPSPRAG